MTLYSFALFINTNHSSFGQQIGSLVNPLDMVSQTTTESEWLEMILTLTEFQLYQYFIKVVATEYNFLNGTTTHTNQFAVTEHLRDVQPKFGNMPRCSLRSTCQRFDLFMCFLIDSTFHLSLGRSQARGAHLAAR